MKALLIVGCMLFASNVLAADCVKTPRGKTICSNGEQAVVVNPNAATVTTTQQNPGGVTTVQSSNGQKAVYNANSGTVTTTRNYRNGATTAQDSNGTKAAYNPNTGNAAVAKTNQNGVTTTRTARGGEAKTKNGMGVATVPNGTKCAKGVNNSGCRNWSRTQPRWDSPRSPLPVERRHLARAGGGGCWSRGKRADPGLTGAVARRSPRPSTPGSSSGRWARTSC